MKKLILILLFITSLILQGCNDSTNPIIQKCEDGYIREDSFCVLQPLVCEENEELINEKCIPKTTIPNLNICPDNQTSINSVCKDSSVITQKFSLSDLQSDFDYIVQYIEDNNPMLFTDRQNVDSTITRQRKLIEGDMTLMDFFRVIAPVVSSYNCGRTRLLLPNEINDFFYHGYDLFPLETRIVNKKLYVIDNYSDATIELGSEIISINGLSIENIFAEIQKGSSTDGLNDTSIYSGYLNTNFAYFYYLFIDEFAIEYEIDYIDYISKEAKSLKLDGIKRSNIIFEQGSGLPFEYNVFSNYAYIDINSFIGWNGVDEFYDFFEETFKDISEKDIKNLIIDLRDNSGGDPRISSDLFSYIFESSQPYFDSTSINNLYGLPEIIQNSEPHYNGEIYVLVNGGSYSTTAQLIALIENQNIATIIGEEIGGSYTYSDSTTFFPTQYTQISIQSSTTILSVVVSEEMDDTPIVPNYEVSLSIENYLNNTDDVMDYVVSLIINSIY